MKTTRRFALAVAGGAIAFTAATMAVPSVASAGPFPGSTTVDLWPHALDFCHLHPEACEFNAQVPHLPPDPPECPMCGDIVVNPQDLVVNPAVFSDQLGQLQFGR